MRALPTTVAGRWAVACAAAPVVPRRSLLLSTAAAGAGLNAEQLTGNQPLRLTRNASGGAAAAKIRASAADAAQAATFASTDAALAWAKKDNRRFLHVVYRVGDLDKTIKFYTECLGMKLLRKRDIPEEKYSNAFLGYGPEDSHFAVELTYSYCLICTSSCLCCLVPSHFPRTQSICKIEDADGGFAIYCADYGVDKYDIGAGFGHFGIGVDDVIHQLLDFDINRSVRSKMLWCP
jgi:lactoylglutathione lyase